MEGLIEEQPTNLNYALEMASMMIRNGEPENAGRYLDLLDEKKGDPRVAMLLLQPAGPSRWPSRASRPRQRS